ncbi:MAG: SprT family zinc-dependent metalloprotease [Candidatus Saelkia tenebricola]|nr:SprT family zinc-dependent metalloprotease [Candidatus Saelkia tenebricola]
MIIKKEQIILDSIYIDVLYKKIKNLYIVINPLLGKVRISAPKKMSSKTVRTFAISRLEWIKKHQTKFLQQKQEPPLKYLSNEKHYFKGKHYTLNIINHKSPSKVEIINENQINLYLRNRSSLKKREKAITDWHRKQLKAMIPDIIEKWQRIIGVKVRGWGVKQMKTRWGTCNIKTRRIWLNLELIKKPEYCLEYIVVHEMLHLLERKHNSKYRAYMNKYMPQWKIHEKELNRLKL